MRHTNQPNRRASALILLPLLLGLITVLSGCANTGSYRPAQSNVTGPVGTDPVVPASSAARLNYVVKTETKNTDSKTVASQVKSETEGALNQAGYRGAGTDPDVEVSLDVSTQQFDRSGNYYRYEGTAKGSITRVFDKKLLAAKTLNVRANRGLGEANALDNLGTELAEETTNWVIDSATPETIGLAATDLTITLPWYKDIYLNRAMDDYARKFVRVVSGIPGVASVVLASEDPATRTLDFRVVYLAEQFPAGLLKHLQGLSGKDDLNLD